MEYSFAECKERSLEKTVYFRNEDDKEERGYEILKVSVKVSGERAEKILEMYEKAMEELEKRVKNILEKGDSEESPR